MVEELLAGSVVFPASPVEMGPDPDVVEVDVVVVENEEDDDVDDVVELLPGSVGPVPEPVVVGDPVVVVFPELVELVTPVGAEVGVLLVVMFAVEVVLLKPVGAEEEVLDVDVVFVLRLVELEDEELEVTRNSSTDVQSGRIPVLSSRISLPSLSQIKAFKLTPSIEAKISPPAPMVQSMEEF
jgi:hypothetical protein